jgi:hypothetical protein
MEMKQAMISDHNRIKFEIRHKKPLWKISKCLEMTQNNSQCIKKKKGKKEGERNYRTIFLTHREAESLSLSKMSLSIYKLARNAKLV